MRYDILASQLIRTLRGKRSQVALSRRMRCKSNVIYTWESGKRSPTAAVFFHLVARVGVDVQPGLARFLGAMPSELAGADFAQPNVVAAFLRHLREGTSVAEVSRRLGTHRASLSRWFNGQAEPRLPDFLALVSATSLQLLDFLAIFVDPAQLEEARDAWNLLDAQRTLAYRLPWSHAVMRGLELESYQALKKHEPGWLARRLGIDQEDEQSCIDALARSKLIARRKGRWKATAVLTVDTRRNPDAGRQLKCHWASVGLDRLPALEPNESDLFSYNLFTVSERDWTRLRDLHIAYYQELRRIVESSHPAERVGLVNLQLMRLDEHSPGRRVAPPQSSSKSALRAQK